MEKYIGLSIDDLPTPSCLIDRSIFIKNCQEMHDRVTTLGCPFRAHVKTHKTIQGTKIQVDPYNTGVRGGRIVVSTLTEAWSLRSLIDDGTIGDIVYGLPPARSRIEELRKLKEIVDVTLMIDHPSQLRGISGFKCFVKIDCGTQRAGLPPTSESLRDLIRKVNDADVILVGFYCHSGHSYAAKSPSDAKDELMNELHCANTAREYAYALGMKDLMISIGATPTAHASSLLTKSEIAKFGNVEVHAGCYPCNDLQQLCTSLIQPTQIAISVLAEVISSYPDRGEILINAGTIALSKETSSVSGYGRTDIDGEEWTVIRMSQEHGILSGGQVRDFYARRVRIMPQHACITSASYPFYFIIDGDKVVDIWPRATGWT